jgi:predicted metal-dependent phosphoesterase TrpH
MEISSEEGHLLVFGISEYKFGMHHAAFIRTLVDEVGGAIIMAHPYRARVRYNSNPDQLLESILGSSIFDLVDAIEVLNGRSSDSENRFAQGIGRRLNMRGIGGSDAHSPEDVPSFATEFERDVRSTDDLVAELKAGRFRAVDLRRS